MPYDGCRHYHGVREILLLGPEPPRPTRSKPPSRDDHRFMPRLDNPDSNRKVFVVIDRAAAAKLSGLYNDTWESTIL